MNSLWSKLSSLTVEIQETQRSAAKLEVSPVFTRHTTTLELLGAGCVGYGEDVIYETDDQKAFQSASLPDLAGKFTLAEFSARLDELDLFCGTPPTSAGSRDYRRWTFESAALDLALMQNEVSLGKVLDREARPLEFVVSLGLGRPSTITPLLDRLSVNPQMRFKLDADQSWTREFCRELAATGAVQVVDLKGFYSGTPVDLSADADLYQLVAEEFPDAWIEDPLLNEETLAVLEPHLARLTFDAPIHSVADVQALPVQPRCLNIKPSRSGRVRDLLELYELCEQNSIAMYAGGQFELGVGRLQIQELARLFHPAASNDCSPVEFHSARDKNAWPSSPLPVPPLHPGFGRQS